MIWGSEEYTGEELIAALATTGVIAPQELQWCAEVEKAVLNHLVPGTISDTVPEAKIELP